MTAEDVSPCPAKAPLGVDAINQLINQGFPVYACKIKNGKYYDTGNKLEYLKTVVEFALLHPDFSEEFKKYLKTLKL